MNYLEKKYTINYDDGYTSKRNGWGILYDILDQHRNKYSTSQTESKLSKLIMQDIMDKIDGEDL
tara:strand:- start:129 stop:320 length:192 start_codon:yes stop_codon:yes gene_type:complete